MRKSEFIKLLERVPGDPAVGLDVLTNKGSEFWGIGSHCIHTNDGGKTLALTTCRQRAAIPANKLIKVKIPGVDSVACDLKSVLLEFTEKYDISQIPDDYDFGDYSLQEFLCSQVYDDIGQLVRLLEDMLRLFKSDKLRQKYGVLKQ